MGRRLKEGGAVLWVAPSGGRDRRDLTTMKVPVAPFDQKTIDLFRLLGNKSKTPTHFYPMAMASYDLCPPPDFIEAGVESRHLFTEHAEAECKRDYEKLLELIEK